MAVVILVEVVAALPLAKQTIEKKSEDRLFFHIPLLLITLF